LCQTEENKEEVEKGALLLLSQNYHAHKLTESELCDARLREELIGLCNEFEGALDSYRHALGVYEKIKEKTPGDHWIAFRCYNNISELMEVVDHNEIPNYVERAFEVTQRLLEINSHCATWQLCPLLQKGRFYIKYPDLNLREKGIRALRDFCACIGGAGAIQPEMFEDQKYFMILYDYKTQLEDKLSQCAEPNGLNDLLTLAEQLDQALTDDSTLLFTKGIMEELRSLHVPESQCFSMS
jgi:hypothetical protein